MKRKVNTLQGFKKGGKKQDWVSEKISMLMKEGKPQDQAIAMALSMWGQKHEDGGYQVPMYQTAGTTGTIDPNFQFKNTLDTTKGFPQMTTGFTTPMPSSSTTPNIEYQDYFKNKNTEYQGSTWNLKDDASKQKQQRDQATQTINSWQTPQIYGGMDLAGASNLFGQSLGEGNVGMGVLSGLKLATGLGRNIAGGFGRAKREEYAMQDASNKLKNSAKGVGYEEAFANGGRYSQEPFLPTYQDAGMYEEDENFKSDLISKYETAPEYNFRQPVEAVGQNLVPAQESFINQRPLQTSQQAQMIDPNSARDIWTAKTGLSWAEAKKRGYTDGSASGNKALLDRFRKENVASILENKPKRASTRVARATQNRAQSAQQEQPQQQVATPRPRVTPTQQVINKRYNSPNPLGNIYRNMEESEGKFTPADTDNRSRGAKIKDAINNQIRTFGYQLDFENGGYFQEGGMQPGPEEQMEGQMSNPQEEGTEQQGGDQMQQIMQEVSQALQQGVDPQQIVQQLAQMGIPQDQATQLVAQVSQPQAQPQLRHGGYYQEGGEAMDEQMEGENEGAEGETPSMEQIEGQVEQALKQGADPQQVLNQLVQMGMPQEQATQMIQELLQEIQGGETEQEAPEQPMMQNGGEYLKNLKGKTIKNYTYNSKTGNYDVEFE